MTVQDDSNFVPGLVAQAILEAGGPRAFFSAQRAKRTSGPVNRATLNNWLKNGRMNEETRRRVVEGRKRAKTRPEPVQKEFPGAGDAPVFLPFGMFRKEIRDRIWRCWDGGADDLPLHLQVAVGILAGMTGAIVFLWVCYRILPIKCH